MKPTHQQSHYYRNWVGFHTLTRREIKRFARIWTQTLIPPAITTTLYFMVFGKLIGARIGDIHGVSYIDFIAPGLIMMSILTNAYTNVVSSFFNNKLHRNIEEQLVSPMPDALIVLGYVVGGVLRGLAVGVTVTIVTLLFTDLSIAHFVITLSVAILTATVFALAGFISAIWAKSFDDVAIIPTFLLGPLTYLGGVFFSISMLSPSWQIAAQLNPILYVINGFRYGVLGFSDVSHIVTLVMLSILAIALYILACYFMKYSSGIRS